MTSWSQIRGLSFGTMGRTARGTVYSSDGTASSVWFAPPTSWRMENADGSPSYVESATDEYVFGKDGVAVHTAKHPNRLVAVTGVSPTVLFTAYRSWTPMELTGRPPRFGEPKQLIEAEVRGRRGWQVEFDDSYGGPSITMVLDAEFGIALSWRQGEQWVQMESPVLDEDFDPALFTWDGPTVEFEEYLESREQLERQQKMQQLLDMPPTQVGWLPMDISVSPDDGDPLSGALDVTVSATTPTQFGIRRWLTDVGEPEVGFTMDLYAPRGRTTIGPWTVELRTYNAISAEDAARVLAELVLPDPPGNVGDIRDAATARQEAADEAAIVSALGIGRNIDDYLHSPHGVSLLVRTDFSDDGRWRELALASMAPVDSGMDDIPTFEARLTCIDHRDNDGLTVEALVERSGDDPPYYAFIADSISMTHPEMAILVVDCGRPGFGHEPGRTFRVIPEQVQSVENNLSIANMDFRSFADAVDDDGVFRGFPPPRPHVAILQRDELIALSATNRSTPALARFAEELPHVDYPSMVVYETARTKVHASIDALDEPPSNELRVGVDEYLAATAREGLCRHGHVQIRGGHWNLVIDPDTGTLEAAMLRQYQSPEPS